MISPALEKYLMYQQALGQPEQSPIASGASKGMQAAQQSMQMNDAQRSRSQGLAMLSFLANKGQPQRGSGFGGALGAIAQGLPAAGFAYDEARRREEALNHQLMQQEEAKILNAQKHRADEARHLMEMEARAQERKDTLDFKREHQEGLNRYYDIMEKKINAQFGVAPETGNPILDQFPSFDKNTKRVILNRKHATSKLLHEAHGIEKKLQELEEITKDNIVSPTGPMARAMNPVKDVLSYAGNKDLAKERTARKRLDSALRQFNITLEKGMKGGVVSEGMARRFENKEVLPGINDAAPDLKAKLNDILEHLNSEHDSAQISLKYGRQIDPTDLERLFEEQEEAEGKLPPKSGQLEDLSHLSDEELDALIAAEGGGQ